MYKGQPITFKQLLPRGVSENEAYMAIAIVVILFIALSIRGMFKPRNSMQTKIKAIQERSRQLRTETLAPKKRKKPETSLNFMRMVVTRMQLLKNSQIGSMQQRLIEAGFRSKDAIYVFTFFNLILPIILGVIGFIIMQVNADANAAPSKWHMFTYMWPVGGAYMGLKLPSMYVGSVRKKRYNSIQKALSDVLDLMTICAEAGLSLVAMLERVSRELVMAYPEMAEELSMTSIEIGFLPDRNKALSNLADRCTLPEVRGIVSVLIQTEKYGTPIAQALRVLSAEFRQARMLRAEQKAARLPALMTVPMILFILPTLFIVIISPAIVKLLDTVNN